jgi:hypothetical protein
MRDQGALSARKHCCHQATSLADSLVAYRVGVAEDSMQPPALHRVCDCPVAHASPAQLPPRDDSMLRIRQFRQLPPLGGGGFG